MTGSRGRQLPDSDAVLAGLLFAIDPHGLGGIVLRGLAGPVRDRWLDRVRSLLPQASPWLKVPVNVSEERLLGGLDFAATVASGSPVFSTGLLEGADGGVVVFAMAERMQPTIAAITACALDRAEIRVERDGRSLTRPGAFGVIALDEGLAEDETVAEGLAERMAFRIPLEALDISELDFGAWQAPDIAAARRRLAAVTIGDRELRQLAATAAAFGIPSLRAEQLTLRAARAAAALLARGNVDDEVAGRAARLVLPQRARCLPPVGEEQAREEPDQQEPDQQEPDRQEPDRQQADGREELPPEPPQGNDADREAGRTESPDDIIVDAVRAAIPPGLLELIAKGARRQRRQSAGGRGGPRRASRRRGRPIGVRQTDLLAGERLNVLATLKAAAPWQRLRRASARQGSRGLQIRKEDLHVTRYKDRVESTTVFVVDASGSQAAQRLAEVKGAIELLLNDCYVRRDQVALVAFRRADAEILLPPTRALARAKRSLAALPGGGGTPLAAGLDLARELAESVTHHGRTPAIVLLTDGRANVARDGSQGAERAEEEALAAAGLLALTGFQCLLVDTSRRPRPRARTLADAMGATYVALPRADAATLTAAVTAEVA